MGETSTTERFDVPIIQAGWTDNVPEWQVGHDGWENHSLPELRRGQLETFGGCWPHGGWSNLLCTRSTGTMVSCRDSWNRETRVGTAGFGWL